MSEDLNIKHLAIMISGRGSNMRAILEAIQSGIVENVPARDRYLESRRSRLALKLQRNLVFQPLFSKTMN